MNVRPKPNTTVSLGEAFNDDRYNGYLYEGRAYLKVPHRNNGYYEGFCLTNLKHRIFNRFDQVVPARVQFKIDAVPGEGQRDDGVPDAPRETSRVWGDVRRVFRDVEQLVERAGVGNPEVRRRMQAIRRALFFRDKFLRSLGLRS